MNTLIARQTTEIELAYKKLSQAKIIGCDTETSGLSPQKSKLFCVQFSDGDFNVLVPISENIALGKLSEILETPNIIKIFHNARFDLAFLNENGYEVKNVFDTMVAEKLLTKGANQSVSLAETLYRYYAVDLDKNQRKKFNKSWDGVWTEDLVEYAMNDVFYLPQLMQEQDEWLERLGLKEDFKIQMKKIIQ